MLAHWNQRLSRACIVHLVIKRTDWSYVTTMSCGGSHLGITISIKNTKFVKDLPMIDAQFRFNRCNSFREEYISVFSPYGLVLILWPVVAAILDFRSANDSQVKYRTTQWLFLQSHNSIDFVVSDKKIFKISANENTLWTMAAMLDFTSAPKTQIW